MIPAFSRQGPHKTYVQHKLKEHAFEVNEILQAGGYVYVCGDAKNMARDVNTVLGDIVEEFGALEKKGGASFIKQMRTEGRYLEDVWS